MAGIIIAAVVIVLLIVIVITGYKKAPPDTAFIISGLRKKVIIGKASVKIPFLERLDKLSLKLIAIDVKTSNAVPTADYINIQVDAAVNIKISSEKEKLALAAENFLNQNTPYIAGIAREVLEGNMREIVGRMRLEEMVSDRQKFANLVKENAEPDLAAMGLDIVSFNVQNFADSNGVIDDLGIDNISQIKKEGAVAKAEADKQANDARINAEREIAKKNNELALQKAELKKLEDTKRAEADAAYSIQQQEQRKTIEIATQEASIAKQEKEVVLKQKEAEVKEKALDAEIKKKAEADKFARQQNSEAELYERMKNAEAEKFEKEKEAEALKIAAEAQKFTKEQEAEGIKMVGKATAEVTRFTREQEAEGIRLVGEAEAEAIRAKGIAEAEAMEKKALAYQKYNDAAMAEMLIQVLPEIAGKIAEPLTQIDKITIIGGDNSNGVSTVADNVPGIMTKLFETMKETVGIDLSEIVKSETYDAKVNRNINITGLSKEQQGEEAAAALSEEIVSKVDSSLNQV